MRSLLSIACRPAFEAPSTWCACFCCSSSHCRSCPRPAARAGACDNQQVSISPRGDQYGRAALYNEELGNPMGKRHAGSVCWRLDLVKAAGQADKLVVHADVEIPDLGMRMEMDFSHNAGMPASASHHVSIKFEHPADIAGDEVVYAPGYLVEVVRARQRRSLRWSRDHGRPGFVSGRPIRRRSRSQAQPAAFEGAILVRYSVGVCQSASRHPRGREGLSRRADFP